MSVTLLSTPSTPSSAKAAENTTRTNNDDPSSGQDFASLLFAQLLLPPKEKIAEIALDTTPSITLDATAPDASNMLAALGIIPVEIKPLPPSGTVNTAALDTSIKVVSESSIALQIPNEIKPLLPAGTANAAALDTSDKSAQKTLTALQFQVEVKNHKKS